MQKLYKILALPLRLLWRSAGGPLHNRLAGRYFRATIGRLDSTLGDLRHVRGELTEIRAELASVRASQERAEAQLAGIVGDHWDSVALVRRLSVIEDGLIEQRNGATVADEPSGAAKT